MPALVFVADAQGRTVFCNERMSAFAGVSRESILADEWLKLLHSDDVTRARKHWNQAVATGRPCEGEWRLRRHDGDYRMHACRAEPCHDEAGNVTEWFGACIDIEEQRRAQASLRNRIDDLQALLDTVPVGVLIAHDPDCRRITGNRAATKLLRSPPDANLSKSALRGEAPAHFYMSRAGVEIPVDRLPVQRAARGETVESEELDYLFDDGTALKALVSARPLYHEAGRVRGAVASLLDVTQMRSVEASDRRKGEFLAELSHELRNTLAPLVSALELLKVSGREPARVETLTDVMERQLAHAVSLVDDLLDVSRISRGSASVQRAALDLREVVQAAVEIARPAIAEGRHELQLRPAEQPLKIHGDARRLTQVVVNLLVNAARYTNPGGRIDVWTTSDARNVELHVRDNGLGIPPEHLGEIFGMFTQVPRSGDECRRGGLGIGLAVARRIVELHDGTIEAQSEGRGRGSELIVRLPRDEELM